ncbi:AbrB/MazE/SpoVT family DNA-binding domain-containing protein [Methanoregula sp.]|uniref:AbrB/MazE/SpoVT family DNA-binding domain-containing protein n=1 Tax=Methanoregula sp. TaxID=2052170 RepID=UPI003C71AE89
MQRIASHKVQTTTGSFSVVLPVVWARKHGIAKGTVVDIFVENDWLIIIPDGVSHHEEVSDGHAER